jgi:hypothetical protein
MACVSVSYQEDCFVALGSLKQDQFLGICMWLRTLVASWGHVPVALPKLLYIHYTSSFLPDFINLYYHLPNTFFTWHPKEEARKLATDTGS